MSAFLGPIHFWLYRKIKLQDSFVDKIVSFAEENGIFIKEVLDNKYGFLVNDSLENIIDESNIHGWLQDKVSVVEYRYAHAVTEILKKDAGFMEGLRKLAFEFGSKEIDGDKSTPKKVFQLLNDSLLDGMPCDHANSLISEEENKVEWKRNQCVHGSYWEEVGGDINIYYELRDEMIQGLLVESDCVYKISGDGRYSVEVK